MKNNIKDSRDISISPVTEIKVTKRKNREVYDIYMGSVRYGGFSSREKAETIVSVAKYMSLFVCNSGNYTLLKKAQSLVEQVESSEK